MCGYCTCNELVRDTAGVPNYECVCDTGYLTDENTGKCTVEKICDAYTFGTGVVAFDDSAAGCVEGVQLSSVSSNSCRVKCDTGYHAVNTETLYTEDSSRSGMWGGTCTCPDGTVYQVGDRYDYCQSLNCVNGVSGTCNSFGNTDSWSNQLVTCGSSDTIRCVDGTLLAQFTCEPNSCDSEPVLANSNPECSGTASYARCPYVVVCDVT